MLEHLLRAKMIFFTRTRAGSIIQRFSVDLVCNGVFPSYLRLTRHQEDVLECAEKLGATGSLSLDGESTSSLEKTNLT